MACVIDTSTTKIQDWTIDDGICNRGIKPVMFENYEYAGVFTMKHDNDKQCNSVDATCSKKDIEINECNRGSSSSVKTSDGYCNFHTHPYPCYLSENTVWGWPSGEDMRECVRFALRGNLVHMVFTLEGIYHIQVNPNITRALLDDTYLRNKIRGPDGDYMKPDLVRGVAISLLESYFCCTHGHRTIEYNVQYGNNAKNKITCDTSRSFGICMPGDWVEYANKFCFGNMKTSNNRCSGMLSCKNVPQFLDRKRSNISLASYLENYGIDIYELKKDSKIRDITNNDNDENDKYYKCINSQMNEIISLFNIANDLRFANESWSKGQWFHVGLVYNNIQGNPFGNTLSDIIRKNGNNPTEICKSIREIWEYLSNNKTEFNFNKVTIPFKPYGPKGGGKRCNLVNGNLILNWINTQRTTQRTRKASTQRTRKARTKRKPR